MELRELVLQAHTLREQIKSLQAQKNDLEGRLSLLEQDIKSRLDDSEQDYANLSEEEFQLLMADLGNPMKLTVEVVFATRERQFIREAQVPRGASIEDGIIMSGILEECPEIDLQSGKVGVYGAIKPMSETLRDGDRIEIYRPVEAKQG